LAFFTSCQKQSPGGSVYGRFNMSLIGQNIQVLMEGSVHNKNSCKFVNAILGAIFPVL